MYIDMLILTDGVDAFGKILGFLFYVTAATLTFRLL